MGKLTIYIIMMAGLSLIFYFAGLLQNTGTSLLLNLLLNYQNIQTSTMVTTMLGIFATIGLLATLAINFYVINLQTVLKVGFAVFMFNTGIDFLKVSMVVSSVNTPLAILIFAPLIILYVTTIYEFYDSTAGER